jgi:hypothetical protein
MKWTLLVILLGFAVSNSIGQKYYGEKIRDYPVNIPVNEVNKTFVAPPAEFSRLKSARTNQANIEVAFVNFPDEAKQAFKYAVSIWESLLTTNITINVLAEWKPLEGNSIALSRPSMFYHNFDGAQLQNVYYPVVLAEKLSGKDFNPGQPDIICSFSSNFPWYFGTDGNTPVSKYDFVTSVLHELTHGLGFSGFLKDSDGTGFFNNNRNLPIIYDYFVFNQLNQQISDKSLFESPSSELYNQLTSDQLKLYSHEIADNEQNAIGWLYAPPVWDVGSSLYHLKKTDDSDENNLMNAFFYKGAAYHNPGKTTLNLMAKIGWAAPSFNFEELKDLEEPCAAIPVEFGITGTSEVEYYDVTVVFSTDYFSSADTVSLQYTTATEKFSGKMPVDFYSGNIQYYFTIKDNDKNNTYTLPGNAPEKKFTMRVGPDYFAPQVNHNPVKIISKNATAVNFSAMATDNMGIVSVKIEYKLNGVLQEPLYLSNDDNDIYKGVLNVKKNAINEIEYRIVAKDISSNKNTKTIPNNGFYSVQLFNSYDPVESYVNNFDNNTNDFTLADFNISSAPGFSSGILHTHNPYPVSELKTETNNLVAQLNYPVVLQPGGQMSFDEVVLVEPGEKNQNSADQALWDFGIVEASKNNGLTWSPLTEEYNSGKNTDWFSAFTGNLKSSKSEAAAQENMLVTRTINITENTDFEAGDTLIFRFRLASDYSVNGWGWAIDNLSIQEFNISPNDVFAENRAGVYPNPFKNSFFVDCSSKQENTPVEIVVTNLMGKTVYRETGIDPIFSPKMEIDLSGNSAGIYLVSVNDGRGNVNTNKIVKN